MLTVVVLMTQAAIKYYKVTFSDKTHTSQQERASFWSGYTFS